jgi:hypothetical protein
MGCGSRPWARGKPLAARYITHSKFNRARFSIPKTNIFAPQAHDSHGSAKKKMH